ncbi:hypothetical protein [Massilia sp. Leaf139]|uniref:hypothetical protein n=1 Tax=Massilia sp. Leaf139 TaxID=1736272 RepID=UPI0006FB6F0A|nr:hypothetical protein [Massilia sp. Leaf139]KQQ90387.1 hypothetical protein ASF77_23320 [Massilia sp. Leaf139]
MGLLNKSAILGAEDLKHEDVEVAAWGGTVRVRMMTGAERDEFRQMAAQFEDGIPPVRFASALLALTCIDEAGVRVFTLDDLEALEAKSAGSIDIPAAVSMRLNGFGAQAMASAEKNSASSQSDDSGSGSPSHSEEP